MRRAYRLALLCGALPLLAGVTIFLTWLITGWGWLRGAGGIVLLGGVFVVAIGAIVLIHYLKLGLSEPELSRRRLGWSIAGGAALLLSNFLVAGGILAAVDAIETRYTVVVHNASRQQLEDVRVVGGGCDEAFGIVPGGARTQRSFWIQQDGQLEYRATQGASTQSKIIDDYVGSSSGGYVTVTVHPDGTVSYEHAATTHQD